VSWWRKLFAKIYLCVLVSWWRTCFATKSTKKIIKELKPWKLGHNSKTLSFCREKNRAREIVDLFEYEIVQTKSNNF
jgi:hypothetical protein